MQLTPGEKIRLLRLSQNLKQSDLAEMVGLNIAQISIIETGRVQEWEQRILDKLGYSPTLDSFLTQMAGKAEAA